MQMSASPLMLSRLMRPINGRGGFQALLRKLRSQLVNDQLIMHDADLERLSRYSFSYGGGGFQARTVPVALRVQGTLDFDGPSD